MPLIKLKIFPFLIEFLSGMDVGLYKSFFLSILRWSYIFFNMVNYIDWFWILTHICIPMINSPGNVLSLLYIFEFNLIIYRILASMLMKNSSWYVLFSCNCFGFRIRILLFHRINSGTFLAFQFYRKDYVEYLLLLPWSFGRTHHKVIWPGLFFVGRFLTTNLISLTDKELFMMFISSWVNFHSLCVSDIFLFYQSCQI